MKLVIVDTYYPKFLKTLSENSKSYEDRLRTLLNARFGTSDFYSYNLKNLGHQAVDLVVNDPVLQNSWTQSKISLTGWRGLLHKWTGRFFSHHEELVIEQILSQKPDVAYFQDLNVLRPRALQYLRNHCLVVGQIACPLPEWNQLKNFDVILSSFPHYVSRFKDKGIDSEYFKIGFEPRVLENFKGVIRNLGVTFVGGYSGHHRKSIQVFERLAQEVSVDFWGYGVDALEKDSPILKSYHGEAWALDMYHIFARSKITLNRHIDVAEDYANNMRLFEATGMGALLITDHKKNIGDLFEVGKEVITFQNETDLKEKVIYFLNHPEEAEKIAKNGQLRTLKDHSYPKRMRELTEILGRYV